MQSSSSETSARARMLAQLADEIVGLRLSHPTRVGVDGVDAAGKTTLADELAARIEELGRRAIRASGDSFHQPVHAAEETAAPDAVLVLDGVFLGRPELASCWDYRIYLAIEEAESLRRGAVRDAWFLGGEDEARRRYEQRYIPGQRLYVEEAAPEQSADVVLDMTDPALPKLVALATSGTALEQSVGPSVRRGS